jgi:hypothetical protein
MCFEGNLGPPPSAMRPCAGSRRRDDARTGTDGGVRRLRLHACSEALWPLTCGVQDAFLLSPSSSLPGFGLVSMVLGASVVRCLALARPSMQCA